MWKNSKTYAAFPKARVAVGRRGPVGPSGRRPLRDRFVGRGLFPLLLVTAFVLACQRSGLAQVPSEAERSGPGSPSPGDTIVLTLLDAEERALSSNPALLAERRIQDIAEGELRQAEVYRYNPAVEFEAETLDPAAGSGPFSRYEAVIAQELEWAGQWGLRQDAAAYGVDEAAALVSDAERLTLLEVRDAFFGAVAAQRRAEVAADIAELTRRLGEATRAELEAGEVTLLDANLAEIESGRGRARLLSAERRRESAFLELKRVLGLAPGARIRVALPGAEEVPPARGTSNGDPMPDPTTLSVDSLVGLALERRPDLRGADAAVAQARELERLSRREAIPNLRLLAPIRRRGSGAETEIGLGVGISVPVWNRNQGTSRVREAAFLRSRHRQEAVTLGVRTEVRDAVQAYRRASEERKALESSVLGPADTNLELLEESYRAGKIDLTTLLLLQNQLLDARLEYWDAWLAQRRAHARLRAAVGSASLQADTGDDR